MSSSRAIGMSCRRVNDLVMIVERADSCRNLPSFLERLNMDLKEALAKIEELEDIITAQNSRIDDLENEVGKLESEIDDLESEVSDLEL